MASIEEKIKAKEKEVSQLQAILTNLENKQKIQERKARTKRLIELGAIIESKFSDDALLVLKEFPKERLANVEKWLVNHKPLLQH